MFDVTVIALTRGRITISIAAAIAFFVGMAAPVAADTLRVPGDYPTIQEAVDAAVDGDLVLVEPGVYEEAIDLLGKSIDLVSEAGARRVTLNAIHHRTSVIRCVGNGAMEVRISGFSIRGGVGTFENETTFGGGIFCRNATLTIEDCLITGNVAEIGAGMDAADSSVTILGTQFQYNVAIDLGGGYAAYNSLSRVLYCEFLENHSFRDGGGIHEYESDSLISNCIFQRNTASYKGGGYFTTDRFGYSENHVSHGLFVDNRAGSGGSAMQGGHGGDLITNSIFFQNGWSDIGSYGTPVYFSRLDNPDRQDYGLGNTDRDPRIVEEYPGEFYLLNDSPCIEAGSMYFEDQSIVHDYDSNPRLVGAFPDMGPYEYQHLPREFRLRFPDWGYALRPCPVEIGGAPRQSTSYLVASYHAGNTPVPDCPGLEVEIENPLVVCRMPTDRTGSSIRQIVLPGRTRGRTVYFQAVDPERCEVSNWLGISISWN